MKTKKEHDMTPSEIAELILPWAETLDDPIFNNAMAYKAIDCIGEPKNVSDALRHLFKQGTVARKMMDGTRYAYALIDKAPDDFERAERLIKKPSEAGTPYSITPPLAVGKLSIPEDQNSLAIDFNGEPNHVSEALRVVKEPPKGNEDDKPYLTLRLTGGKLTITGDQESPTTAKQESGKLSAIDVCKDGLLEKIEMIEGVLHIAKKSAREGQLTHALEYIDHAATQCQLDELLINVIKVLDSQK